MEAATLNLHKSARMLQATLLATAWHQQESHVQIHEYSFLKFPFTKPYESYVIGQK